MSHIQRLATILLTLLASVFAVSAQDIIVTTDGDAISAKVLELTDTSIKYKNFGNQQGPTFELPVSQVKSLIYENGRKVTFEPQATQQVTQPTQSTQPNPQPQTTNNQTRPYSQMQQQTAKNDAELMRQYQTAYSIPNSNAKKLRIIGWVGGTALLASGIIAGSLIHDVWGDTNLLLYGGIGLGAGAIWCTAFNLAANHQKKKARAYNIYSSTIMEQELFNAGNSNLCAGVDMLTDSYTKNRAIGVGLRLNF
ncbi:MAG: hypothetical protein NC349_10250 [Paenibacillus sp.]|nr:hypothetical protein [Paenibacillus sp.]